MRCKFFFRNLTRSKIFNSKFVELWKNGSKSDAFKILDSKYDALYNKWFKNWIFWKILIQKFFIKEQNNFSRNNFSMNAQKSQLWSFYRVYWPDKTFFESQFSNKLWFSKNSFLIELWCVVKVLIQVLTLCGCSSYTLTRSNFLFKSLRRCKKIDSKPDFSQSSRFKACFFPKTSLSETRFLRNWEKLNFDILTV